MDRGWVIANVLLLLICGFGELSWELGGCILIWPRFDSDWTEWVDRGWVIANVLLILICGFGELSWELGGYLAKLEGKFFFPKIFYAAKHPGRWKLIFSYLLNLVQLTLLVTNLLLQQTKF